MPTVEVRYAVLRTSYKPKFNWNVTEVREVSFAFRELPIMKMASTSPGMMKTASVRAGLWLANAQGGSRLHLD